MPSGTSVAQIQGMRIYIGIFILKLSVVLEYSNFLKFNRVTKCLKKFVIYKKRVDGEKTAVRMHGIIKVLIKEMLNGAR